MSPESKTIFSKSNLELSKLAINSIADKSDLSKLTTNSTLPLTSSVVKSKSCVCISCLANESVADALTFGYL